MSRDTQRKGDLAKAKAVEYFTKIGCDVAFLLTESAPYDLIVDDGELHRVQVKYTSRGYVDMRRIHSNSKGYVVKQYDISDFDWLYVYTPNRGSFLIRDASGKKHVSLYLEYSIVDGWQSPV